MKKSMLSLAVALSLCVPAFAEQQFVNDSKHASEIPVFGMENQARANLGIEDLDHKNLQESKRLAKAKKSESYVMADEDQEIDLDTGRMKQSTAKRLLAENDPDYVPPVENNVATKEQKNKKTNPATQPVFLNGDHVEFDSDSGDFVATGKVSMKQGTEKLQTSYAFGNMKSGDIYLLQGGTLLEPGNHTEAKWMHYNYVKKTGEMKEVSGRGLKDFFKAPHVLVMPDKLLADKGGVTTRCTAKEHTPCMHIEAKSLEFYPKEKMVAHDVKFFVKGVHVYSRKLWINEFDKPSRMLINPSVGWDGHTNGFYGKINWDEYLSKNDSIRLDMVQYSRAGYKPEYKFIHDEKNWEFRYFYGWDEDDDNWYHKQNDFRLKYKPHHLITGIPITLSANIEYGLWSKWDPDNGMTKMHQNKKKWIKRHSENGKIINGHYENLGTKSWHREYAYYLNHDPIKIFGPDTTLHLTYGRKWVHESLTDKTEVSNLYYVTLRQRINDRLRFWVSNMREKFTTSLFGLGQPDMEREFRVGVQYKPTKNDTLSIVNRYDYQNHKQYQTTYNWYHRFCCWAFQLSYEKNWHSYDNGRNKDSRDLNLHVFFYNW